MTTMETILFICELFLVCFASYKLGEAHGYGEATKFLLEKQMKEIDRLLDELGIKMEAKK